MTTTISMKKLYKWIQEYPQWKKNKGYNWDMKEFSKRTSVILDYLNMIWEIRNK